MKLSRRNSFIIAIGTLVSFFVIATLFLATGTKQTTIRTSSLVTLDEATSPSPDVPAKEVPSESPSNFSLKEFHRSETKDGKKTWEVYGSEGKFFPQDNAVQISNAKVYLYKNNGQQIEVQALKARVYLLGAGIGKADLESKVVINLNQNSKLETEKLIFDKVTNTAFSPGLVKVTNEFMEITGEELHADLEKKEFTLLKNVVSILKPKANKDE